MGREEGEGERGVREDSEQEERKEGEWEGGGKGGEIRERGEKGTEKGEGDGDREGRRDKEEELGMSMFRFFVIEQFVFYCPSEKKLCFVSFLFEIQKQKKRF